MAITKDDKYLIIESLDRSLHLYDLRRARELSSIENKILVTTLLVSPEIPLCVSINDKIALFQTSTNSIGVFDINRRELCAKLENITEGNLLVDILKIY